jgi:hypothetical protein
MRFQRIFDDALTQENRLMSLRDELIKLRAEGVDRETLMSELTTYHDQLETEADHDLVLEALDYLYGWCNPALRID